MLPRELRAEDFKTYPPQAKKLATEQIDLLRQLPLGFVSFLLKEVISFDWKFPVEQWELDQQFDYLRGMSASELKRLLSSFSALHLTPELESADWVNAPGRYLEIMSAHLWASHQMDGFRRASEEYVSKVYASMKPAALPTPRLGIVVFGQGVSQTDYLLFRKLKRNGVYYNRIEPEGGWAAILAKVQSRAKANPSPFSHWYVDGGALSDSTAELTRVSYHELAPARTLLADKMRKAYETPVFQAEAFRTMLAQLVPASLGMVDESVLDRFQVSLLTEGSGTQVYSTTFVQWAAREVYRRAQPLTLLARYAPRLREQPMNELLNGTQRPTLDPHGSLIDADMGAYYTWLNQQRLPGSEQSSFVVWFEGHHEAVAISPHLDKATTDSHPIDLATLLGRV